MAASEAEIFLGAFLFARFQAQETNVSLA